MWGNKTLNGEMNLGIANDPQHEINKYNYIQLDVSDIADTKSPRIIVQNIQDDGGFALYGSNQLGKIGVLLYTSPDFPSEQITPLPEINTYKYISITAAGSSIIANVLLQSIKLEI